jgi:hypothetical protein
MKMNIINKIITKGIFWSGLRKAAHSKKELELFISKPEFKKYDIIENPLGFEVWLYK